MQGVAPQNRHIISLTKAFLNVHWDRSRPLLLGFSGGSDSEALLHALLESGVKPHLAHVDHGWRTESAQEAKYLQAKADSLGLPFFSTRLQIGKKEEEARQARFAFFQSLIAPYQALLLAHHADDLAETVLKRIFEGAHLPYLGGMQPISEQYGMTIWRPFLEVTKQEITSFLETRGLQWLCDSSNFDPAYLRSRMRSEMLPFLNETFGKEITANLNLLSARAYELKEYLDQRTSSISIHKGPWGSLVDLRGIAAMEQRHMLQKLARQESVSMTRPILETLLKWLQEDVLSRHLIVKNRKIFVSKGRVCLIFLSSTDSISI